jgi:hypothetical protein
VASILEHFGTRRNLFLRAQVKFREPSLWFVRA